MSRGHDRERYTISVYSNCGHRQWGLYEGAEGECPDCGVYGKAREVVVVPESALYAEVQAHKDTLRRWRAEAAGAST